MHKQRRQLPLPDDTAPKTRRPPAPLPGDDSGPPPPLPSRGGGGGGGPPLPSRPLPNKPMPPPPSKNSGYSFQKSLPPKPPSRIAGGRHPGKVPPPYSLTSNEDEYTETEVGDEVYAECQDDQFQQEEYDDFNVKDEEEEVQPQQEEYDEFSVDNEEEYEQDEYDEFEVQGDVEDTQESYDEFAMVEEQTYEVGDEIVQDVYEAVEDGGPPPALPPARHAPRAPLPPPPTQSSPSPPAPPPPAVKRSEKKPAEPPKPKKQAGVVQGGLDLNELLNRRNKLKSTSMEETSPPPKSEPKEYLDNMDVKSRFNLFKKKEEEAGLASPTGKKANFQIKKPEIKSPKPDPPKPSTESDNIKSWRSGLKPIASEDRPSLPPRPGDDRLPPPPPPVEEEETSNGQKSSELPPPPPVKDSYCQVQPKSTAPLVNNGNQNDWPDDDDEQDVYDDVLTSSDPLKRYNWYFGEIEREKGNTLLKKLSKDGAYLLRKSNRGGPDQPYTLMVLYNSHVYNLKVRLRKDEKYALGEEKPDEITFENVEALVEHHQNNDVILVQKAGSMQHKTTLLMTPD